MVFEKSPPRWEVGEAAGEEAVEDDDEEVTDLASMSSFSSSFGLSLLLFPLPAAAGEVDIV